MLVPAIVYKKELEELFLKEIYSKDYFYFAGYVYCHAIPRIELDNNSLCQYAIIDNEKVIGYLSYNINFYSESVHSFKLYSFDKGNCVIGKDLFYKMEELIKRYHRIEWEMVGGNPVKKHYDKFCKKYGGNVIELHDVGKDMDGNYYNTYIYEIINN